MLGYIKKFVLDSFPSIIATIIGAYIVHHYVIPAAAPQAPASAMASDPAIPIPGGGASPEKASLEKASFEKAVAEKSAIEKTAEKAVEKSSEPSAETKRRHATPRLANRGTSAPSEATGSVESGTAEERRDANELARAAIERLRNAPAARTVASAPPATTHSGDDALRTIAPLQPLPPAATVTKGPDVFDGGAEATGSFPAQRPEYTRPVEAAKLTPPADIPDGNPIELHAEAQATGKPSITEDVVSAAKSVFHAVVPR